MMADCYAYYGHFRKHHLQDNSERMDQNFWYTWCRHDRPRSTVPIVPLFFLFWEFGAKHIRMTTYHPCANGLVKIFHQSLKTSLATKPDMANWVDHLPLIFLTWRNMKKEDLRCSPTKLVFGTLLSLPGEYFDNSLDTVLNLTTLFVRELCHKMAWLKYTPPQQQPTNSYIPQHLQGCEFIFIRNDTMRRPLTLAY